MGDSEAVVERAACVSVNDVGVVYSEDWSERVSSVEGSVCR